MELDVPVLGVCISTEWWLRRSSVRCCWCRSRISGTILVRCISYLSCITITLVSFIRAINRARWLAVCTLWRSCPVARVQQLSGHSSSHRIHASERWLSRTSYSLSSRCVAQVCWDGRTVTVLRWYMWRYQTNGRVSDQRENGCRNYVCIVRFKMRSLPFDSPRFLLSLFW